MDTFFDSAEGTIWGDTIMYLAEQGSRSEASYMRDPEAIRCHETGRAKPGTDIYLGKRQYTDVALGMLDGPVRDDKRLLETFQWTARTPKAQLTRKQRRKLRKAKRAANRKGVAFDEENYIAVSIITIS